MFSQAEIKKLFEPYTFIAFYTDRVPNEFYAPALRNNFKDLSRQRTDAETNLEFLRRAFGTIQLPLYVVLEPRTDGKVDVVGVYAEGLINNVSQFAEFLRNPKGGAIGT